MKTIIFDEDGMQYEFENVNFLEKDSNKNSLYSIKLNTEQNEFFRIVNAVAILKEIKPSKKKNKLEIKIKNAKEPLFLYGNDINLKFKENTNIYFDIDTYEVLYFYRGINYVCFCDNLTAKPVYQTGYFIFNDGSLLNINDIIKVEKVTNNNKSYDGFIVYSKEKTYAINNCIAKILYNKNENSNKNDILNLVIENNHIELEGIVRTDVEFYFIDNKEKISHKLYNKNINLDLTYYYRHFSSVWFSKKENPIVNLQSGFRKNKNRNILSL